MSAFPNITGIILAGGKSKRMGMDKSLVRYQEKRLVEYPIDLLQEFCNEIIISSEPNKLTDYNFPKVADEKGQCGPLSGIYSCLKASSNELNIVISCDMPLVSKELITHLLNNIFNFDLVMPLHKTYFEPLCAIYKKTLIPTIDNLFEKQDFSPLSLIPITNINKLEIGEHLDFYNTDLFRNINTLEDLNNE